MLSENMIKSLNLRMLNLGAPIEKDCEGYNKVDFTVCKYLYMLNTWGNKDYYSALKCLKHYVNTQLIEYKDDILEALPEYEKRAEKELEDIEKAKEEMLKKREIERALREAEAKKVHVISSTKNQIVLNWKYNAEITAELRTMDRALYKWVKNLDWEFHVEWNNLPIFTELFKRYGLDISEIVKEYNKVFNNADTEIKEIHVKLAYELIVKRPTKSIDTLEVSISDYNKVISEIISSIPFVVYNSSRRVYSVYIEYAEKLYEKLENLNQSSTLVSINLKQLYPWYELVKSWGKEYRVKVFTDSKIKPYDFQLKDVNLMLKQKHLINANEMGCGKTHESVRVGESLPMKKLVICPASLRLNWQQEIKMVNPKATISIIENKTDLKNYSYSDWNIMSYNTISVDKQQKEIEKANFQVVFIDEAHFIKGISSTGSPSTNRAKAVLRTCATAQYVFPITGTPKTSRNKDIFNLLRLVRHPLTRGNFAFYDYGQEYCEAEYNGYGWNYQGNSNNKELNEKIKPYMIRHLKKDVLPFLKKQRIKVPVQVSLREYNSVLEDYLRHRKSTEAEQLARLNKARMILAKQKVSETIDFTNNLLEQDESVVIATCFTAVVDKVCETFKGNCSKVVGGMTDKDKQKNIDDFQSGKTKVIVINIQAGGVGITLTASSNLIINDLAWTTGECTQVEDRISRPGQTKVAMVYYLSAIGADVEEMMIDLLTSKSSSINEAIDGGTGESINFRTLTQKVFSNAVRKMA